MSWVFFIGFGDFLINNFGEIVYLCGIDVFFKMSLRSYYLMVEILL